MLVMCFLVLCVGVGSGVGVILLLVECGVLLSGGLTEGHSSR